MLADIGYTQCPRTMRAHSTRDKERQSRRTRETHTRARTMEMGPQRHGNCYTHIYKKLLEINLVESRICTNNCCSIRSISMLAEWRTSDAPKNTNPFHGNALPLDYVSADAAAVPWLDNIIIILGGDSETESTENLLRSQMRSGSHGFIVCTFR